MASRKKTARADQPALVSQGRCAIVVMSRLDFPSDSFRLSLVMRAAEIAKEQDVRFGIIAGGLVNERYVREKTRKLAKKIKLLDRLIKQAEQGNDHDLARTRTKERSRYQGYLDELNPETMAQQLAEMLPTFTNAAGETITVYVYPSAAHDGDTGKLVAQLLAEKRHGEYRDYNTEDDFIHVRQADKLLEVVVPERIAWLRGDYYSTSVQRALKDRAKSRVEKIPDLVLVGGFGVALNKQQGEASIRYVGVPILNRQTGVRIAENQIGVATIIMRKDSPDQTVIFDDMKDLLMEETALIPLPSHLRGQQRKLVEMILAKGRMSTGSLASESGLTREQVDGILAPLDNRSRTRRPTNWPGLLRDGTANRWGVDKYGLRTGNWYPPAVPRAERQVDSIVAFSCLHAGSKNTDYAYFLDEVPKVILETGAQTLVNAGDSVEGIQHDLILTGEVQDGLNVTNQEEIASYLLVTVTMKVFEERFRAALKLLGHKPSPEETRQAVDASLVRNVEEHGNHDDWAYRSGHSPMRYMALNMVVRLYRAVANVLAEAGLTCPGLFELVQSTIIAQEVENEHRDLFMRDRVRLPSGLLMGVAHPHMSRAETHSARAQQTLGKFSDCHIVFVGNFHVSAFVGHWEPGLGERASIELGTIKRGSYFEDRKNKTVDFGVAHVRAESHKGRVLMLESTFYGAKGTPPTQRELDTAFRRVRQAAGI